MPDYVVVLVEPEFQSTIGFLARAMKNFGLADLKLVNPLASIGGEAHMWAAHAQDVLENATVTPDLKAALDNVDVSVGTTAQRATSVYRIIRKPVTVEELVSIVDNVSGKIALIFGREGTGLRNEELQICDLTLTLEASPQYPTLNLSHAAAILFHQLYTSKSRASQNDILASGLVKERILESVEEMSNLVNLPLRNKDLVLKAFKSTMGRAGLRAREASLLAGFFRRVSQHLDNGRKTEELASQH